MSDSNKTPSVPAAVATDCLGRTCLKWQTDGELTALDLSLVLARLAQVDQELTGSAQETPQSLPCPSIS